MEASFWRRWWPVLAPGAAAMTLAAVVVVLGIMILVHELGHFIAAKLLGVRVEVFSLGFPHLEQMYSGQPARIGVRQSSGG